MERFVKVMEGLLRYRKILELCAGTGSASRAWAQFDGGFCMIDRYFDEDSLWTTGYASHAAATDQKKMVMSVTVDIMQWDDAEWIDFLKTEGPFDFVWASPDCKCFSIANGNQFSNHWGSYRGLPNQVLQPISEEAKESIELVRRCIWIAEQNTELCKMIGRPWGYWVLENPRGLLRKLPMMERHQRATVTYCQYGDTRMKPTDLWGLFPRTWQPKSCKNGDTCHVPSPRGTVSGTIALTYRDRIKIPEELLKSLFRASAECKGDKWLTLEDYL
jgi:hypothetical protein